MNAKQASRLNAAISVLAVLNSEPFKALWFETKVALTKSVTDLETAVERIMACAAKQEARDGAAAEKALTLLALGDAAHEIAVATRACAVESGNAFLAGQMSFSRTKLTKGRVSSVLARCQSILEAATEHVEDLTDYEVTAAKLKALEKKIAAVTLVQSKPRQLTAASNAATRELSRLFRRVSQILHERIGGLMVPFKTSQPTFYAEYQAARVVIDTQRSRTNPEANVVPAPNTTPATKAA